MSLLWTIPPLAVAAAAIFVIFQLRAMADAATDLNVQLQRLGEVRTAVAQVRADATGTRQAMRNLRAR